MTQEELAESLCASLGKQVRACVESARLEERARAAGIVRNLRPVTDTLYEGRDGNRVADVVDWDETRAALLAAIEGT